MIIKIISILYLFVNFISLAAYLPTLKDLIIKQKQSANPVSYFLWALCNGISLLYSFSVLNDALFRVVSSINFFSCLAVFICSVKLYNSKI